MGKIKLRELIDNLYTGEEIPQKLKHNGKIWLWDEMECFYKLENGTAGLFGTIFDFYNDIDALDTELEIIEEEESDEIKKISSWTRLHKLEELMKAILRTISIYCFHSKINYFIKLMN